MTFVTVDQNRERLTELTRLLLAAFPGSVIYQHTDPLKAPKDVRNNRVDAVFAQFDMGKLGGVELSHILHLEKADLPVFLLSDENHGEQPIHGNDVASYLVRPISVEILREKLNVV